MIKLDKFIIVFKLIEMRLELFYGFSGAQSSVANFAHLGGMVFGFALIQYWRGKLPVKPDRAMRW